MNNRTKASIIGYVGTTISLMNNEQAWKAAQELARKELPEIDAFLQTQSQEIREELDPLVRVIKDPRLLMNGDHATSVGNARQFIIEQITINVDQTLANPPKPFTEQSIEAISAEIRQRQEAMRISPETGNDRLHSTAVPSQGLAWFYTPEGQAYLFGSERTPETREFQEALYEGIRQAFDAKQLLRNMLAPGQSEMYRGLAPILPENQTVKDSVWWFTAAIAFLGNAGTFVIKTRESGILTALLHFLEQGLQSFTEEHRVQLRTVSGAPAVRSSLWQAPPPPRSEPAAVQNSAASLRM